MTTEIRFAHLSDWHATNLDGAGRALWQPKRLSGWLSWRFSRRDRHRVEILDAAILDVRSQSVDRILVTGDLTHVSLESEFRMAASQLSGLGSPEQVFLVPGNHDCYVRVAPEESWDYWASYLQGSKRVALDPMIADCLVAEAMGDEPGRAPRHDEYPTLRVHDRLAVIGLCSAIPMPIFRAGGELGGAQLRRLDRLLAVLRERDYARVVQLHHPLVEADEGARRALRDGAALRDVLARQGADLVLHGHRHRRRVHFLDGPDGKIPIVGVPSSSEVGSRPGKRAQYHLYTLRRGEARSVFSFDTETRGYDPVSGRFVREDGMLLDLR